MTRAKLMNGNAYFRTMSIILISIALVGFFLNGFLNQDKMPSPYFLLIFHAIVMVSWYVLFIVQTRLIKKRHISTHKKLGLWSLLLTISILISGIWITYVAYEKVADTLTTALNFAALFNFSVTYFMGYFYRTRIEWHKRAMLLAGIAIVAPAIARLVIALQLPEPMVILGYLLLILSLIIHDIVRDKINLRFSIAWGLVIFLGVVAAASIGTTDSWSAFLTKIWG